MRLDHLAEDSTTDLYNLELAAKRKNFFPREIEAIIQLHLVVIDYLKGEGRPPEEVYKQLERTYKQQRRGLFEAIRAIVRGPITLPADETRELSLDKEYRHSMYNEYGKLIASMPEQKLPYFYSIQSKHSNR